MFRRVVLRPIIASICILPILVVAFLSFSRNWIYPSVFPRQFTAEAWRDVFAMNSGIGESLCMTLLLATGVSIIATVTGFFSSRFTAYHKQKKWLLFLAYLPFALSPVILGVCLKFYFIKLGLAGKLIGVLLAHLIITFPYSIIFFTGFWNLRIQQYETVVATLGGSAKDAFYKVVLPAARPVGLVCFFQCFLITWFEYGLTSVIGYGKVQTLTIKVYQFVTESNIFYAALSCCLLVLPPLVFLWLNKRIMYRQGR